MRAYTTRVVALTVGVPIKWLDNLLVQYSIPGVESGTQGVERRISEAGVLAIELVRRLSADLGMTVSRAVDVAQRAMAARGAGTERVVIAAPIALLIPFPEIERRIRARLTDAVETVAYVRRGRPRRTRS